MDLIARLDEAIDFAAKEYLCNEFDVLQRARDEILRLRAGNLTKEEFHNWCHNKPCVTEAEHIQACNEFRKQIRFPKD